MACYPIEKKASFGCDSQALSPGSKLWEKPDKREKKTARRVLIALKILKA